MKVGEAKEGGKRCSEGNRNKEENERKVIKGLVE